MRHKKQQLKMTIKKNKICEGSGGLKLLRFWETDINDKPEWVIGELKRHL